MATSRVDIANLALIEIGAKTIVDMDEDNESARVASKLYQQILEELLHDHPWDFAMKRVELAKVSGASTFDFGSKFQLPSDVIRIFETSIDYYEWEIEGDKLLTNTDSVEIRYVSKNVSPNIFPPKFTKALALKIAASMAYTFTQSAALQDRLSQRAQRFLAEARTYDAQQASNKKIVTDEWINSRL